MLQHNKFYVESPDPAILRKLAKDLVIREARVLPEGGGGDDFQVRLCLPQLEQTIFRFLSGPWRRNEACSLGLLGGGHLVMIPPSLA